MQPHATSRERTCSGNSKATSAVSNVFLAQRADDSHLNGLRLVQMALFQSSENGTVSRHPEVRVASSWPKRSAVAPGRARTCFFTQVTFSAAHIRRLPDPLPSIIAFTSRLRRLLPISWITELLATLPSVDVVVAGAAARFFFFSKHKSHAILS